MPLKLIVWFNFQSIPDESSGYHVVLTYQKGESGIMDRLDIPNFDVYRQGTKWIGLYDGTLLTPEFTTKEAAAACLLAAVMPQFITTL